MRQQIHEDPSVPRGQALMSLDMLHVWCHPDDAEHVREHARTTEEAGRIVAERLDAGDEEL